MATESIDYVDSVFGPNDVYELDEGVFGSCSSLAALVVLFRSSGEEGHVMGLQALTQQVAGVLPEYAWWLLLANSSWQPDTSIVRYRGVFGGLKARGLLFPDGDRTDEYVVSTGRGVKCFSGLRLSEPTKPSACSLVASVLECEPACALLASPEEAGQEVLQCLSRGWSAADLGPPVEVTSLAVSTNSVAAVLSGAFDDHANGAVAVGPPAVLRGLR